jgi:hypothetical protein
MKKQEGKIGIEEGGTEGLKETRDKQQGKFWRFLGGSRES